MSRNTNVKECILCEKENTQVYFGICVICHLKIDDAMGYCIRGETRDYLKGGGQS